MDVSSTIGPHIVAHCAGIDPKGSESAVTIAARPVKTAKLAAAVLMAGGLKLRGPAVGADEYAEQTRVTSLCATTISFRLFPSFLLRCIKAVQMRRVPCRFGSWFVVDLAELGSLDFFSRHTSFFLRSVVCNQAYSSDLTQANDRPRCCVMPMKAERNDRERRQAKGATLQSLFLKPVRTDDGRRYIQITADPSEGL
jgi:hypothetical protein